MCGIAGVVDYQGEVDPSLLRHMQRCIAYRGPDGLGMKILPAAGLVHSRLAIIDTSESGSQPMCDTSGRYWLVFNGEIYSYREIREELRMHGVKFNSDSDSEVLLEGYKQWGIDLLMQRISGMFAFAIWDSADQTLVLARDRFGEKPLFLRRSGSSIRFSSTVQGLISPGEKPKLDRLGVYGYLTRGFNLPEFPMLEGVEEFPPGTYEFITAVGRERKRYHKIVFAPEERPVEDWLGELRTTLDKVIASEVVADVPVGCLLSGGVDSALIASSVSKFKDIDLFTVKMTGGIDESPIAASVARRIGGRHHIIEAESPTLDDWQQICRAFSQPLGDSSALGMWMVSKAAANHVKVVLSGDGGDEFFAGYDSIRIQARYRFLRSLFNHRPGQLLARRLGTKNSNPLLRKAGTFLKLVTGDAATFHLNRSHLPASLKGKFDGFYHLEISLEQKLRSILDHGVAEGELDRLMGYDLRHGLLGDYIPKVDVTSMLNGLELRAPFLHPAIADLALSMPFRIKTIGNTSKGILKRLLVEKLGPEVSKAVITGKRGFVVPVDRWIDGNLRMFTDLVMQSSLVGNNILSPGFTREVLDGYERDPVRYSRIRYSLISLSIWYSQFDH